MKPNKAQEAEQLTIEKISKENLQLRNTIKRYSKELELKNRELEIETALERVRARAMGMHNSTELSEVAYLLFQQLKAIGVKLRWCWVSIFDEELQGIISWYADVDGTFNPIPIRQKFKDFEDTRTVFKAWQSNQSFYLHEIKGQELVKYVDELGKDPDFKKGPSYPIFKKNVTGCLYQTTAMFKHGYVGYSSFEPRNNDNLQYFCRFAKVFEQTYTRFLDLQNAEKQVREAIKQASVDRVRGEIASMRSTADLDRITPLVWDELTVLGVPFIRCGVLIVNEASTLVEAHMSDPTGRSLGVMNLPYTSNELLRKTVESWRKKKVYKEHWYKEAFIKWTQTLMDQGHIKNKEEYQGAAKPPESLHMHFVPFTQGMLYVGGENQLVDEQIELVHTLADTFAIAYARYADFAQMEKAKQSVETTLTELKATQSQLIQSEKMASLGELTAGIAHEIKNPLNFVNNFSEVSNELIDEMNEEIEKGDLEEAKAIADDIKQNLEKIKHHGKRADSIVKGMLQHSRSSSGVREPTDLNALAEEYLRLAYHGLRAKDEGFNAAMNSDFDDTIGKINIVPQDIGRAILNLITNAFYAVNESNKLNQKDYEPTVTVTTKRTGNSLGARGQTGRNNDIRQGQWQWHSSKDIGQDLPTLLHY